MKAAVYTGTRNMRVPTPRGHIWPTREFPNGKKSEPVHFAHVWRDHFQ